MRNRETADLLAAALVASVVLVSPPSHAQQSRAAAPANAAPATAAPTSPPAEDAPARTAGFVALVAGGVGIAAGVGLGVASVIEHRRSRDVLSRIDVEDEAQARAASSEYQAATDARDDLRLASGVAAGVGLGAFLAAGVLFAIDEARGTPRDGTAPAPPLSASPALAPGHVGAAATLRF